MSSSPETKTEAEALVPQFQLERVLNQGEDLMVSLLQLMPFRSFRPLAVALRSVCSGN